jgi:hypothetical protein
MTKLIISFIFLLGSIVAFGQDKNLKIVQANKMAPVVLTKKRNSNTDIKTSMPLDKFSPETTNSSSNPKNYDELIKKKRIKSVAIEKHTPVE